MKKKKDATTQIDKYNLRSRVSQKESKKDLLVSDLVEFMKLKNKVFETEKNQVKAFFIIF